MSVPLQVFTCAVCNFNVLTQKALNLHYRSLLHKNKTFKTIEENTTMSIKGALDGNVTEYLFLNHNMSNNESEISNFGPHSFLIKIIDYIKQLIIVEMMEKKSVRYSISVYNSMTGPNGMATGEEPYGFFNNGKIVFESDKDIILVKLYDDVEESVKRVENFIARGSGHAFVKTIQVLLTVVTYNPYKAGSGRVTIPSFLKKRKGIHLDLPNKWDNVECFSNCIDYLHTLNGYKFQLSYDGVSFPTSFKDIRTFEACNKVLVRVYEVDVKSKSVYPVHHIKKERGRPEYFLLLIRGDGVYFSLFYIIIYTYNVHR